MKPEKKSKKIAATQPEIVVSTKIEERIFTVRGRQVMIDRDLALLYLMDLKSQIATSSWGGTRKPPYAFTENGIAMLSSVLRSETAIAVNIKIMRTFTQIKKSVYKESNLLNRIELIEYNLSDMRKLLIETTDKVDCVFENMKGTSTSPVQGVFFDGQIFDAYTFVADLIRKATRRIILIDT